MRRKHALRAGGRTRREEQHARIGRGNGGRACFHGGIGHVRAAGEKMGKLNKNVYLPNEAAASAYDLLYAEYTQLHDYFGRGENDVMHRLKALKRNAAAAADATAPANLPVLS